MNACAPLRGLLYLCVFVCSVVLLGLTAYRIHYTKGLSGGDILTNRSHFYDPVIVELLVSACLAILFSLFVIPFLFARKGGSIGRFATEHILMWPLWIMLLVGAAVMTHKWDNLKWCRGSYKACRILETIKAFSWIVWGLLTLALLASLIHMFTSKQGMTGAMHGEDEGYRAGTYPETRQTTTVNTTHTRPVGTTDTVPAGTAVA